MVHKKIAISCQRIRHGSCGDTSHFMANKEEHLMNTKVSDMVFALVLAVAATTSQAVELNPGAVLSITSGTQVGDAVTSGSWFGFNGFSKQALSQGTTGLVIGGSLNDPNAITNPWEYYSVAGSNYLTTPVTGGTSGLNMSGWVWSWNGNVVSMASGAWGLGYADGVANFSWDGMDEHAYTLDYHATASSGALSGFQYALHLEGCVALTPESMCVASPTPEADTWAMMLAGLGLIGATLRYNRR